MEKHILLDNHILDNPTQNYCVASVSLLCRFCVNLAFVCAARVCTGNTVQESLLLFEYEENPYYFLNMKEILCQITVYKLVRKNYSAIFLSLV